LRECIREIQSCDRLPSLTNLPELKSYVRRAFLEARK
jgi:hypothetical protein